MRQFKRKFFLIGDRIFCNLPLSKSRNLICRRDFVEYKVFKKAFPGLGKVGDWGGGGGWGGGRGGEAVACVLCVTVFYFIPTDSS